LHPLDKDIIEGLNRDHPQAMKRIYDLYYVPLCCYAARYVTSRFIAEEIVSDVMYKRWQNRHSGYRTETFREYLFTATRNTTLNYLKQQQNQKKLTDRWAEQLRNELVEETPLDKLITEELHLRINRLMDMLPEQCRKAFLMSRMDDMTYEEIAAQMDISVNTVKYHIKIALQKLRAEIF
jgi:RNA polymerase sigma-70 factor (ECF subfamily)